jgi:ubiquitin-like protein ATG12
MASSSSPSTQPLAPPSPEAPPALDDEVDAAADLPMTMAASVVLEHLPKDAHQALETAGALEQEKGTHNEKEHCVIVYQS